MSHLNIEVKKPFTSQSLNDLIIALLKGEQSTYDDIMRSVKLPISVFRGYCSWSDKSYRRNCIVSNEKFELILLCWKQGQVTPIHNHGGEECWVKVIDGEFRETIYKTDEVGLSGDGFG